MIRKNIYSRITESIVNAYHDNNLDTAMDDGHEMENMGKKIVAIITADPDQDLDWESEYEPFGATELTADDEQEAMEHDGIETADECEGDECDAEQDVCVSCGHPVMDDEEDDDMEDIMIGGGFESEDEVDEYEDMDVKDILVDILHELKGEDSEEGETEEEGAFETSDENPMFGGSSDDEDDYEDDEDEDADSMLSAQDDWSSEESDDDAETEEDYDDEEDFEAPVDDMGEEDMDDMLAAPQEQEEDEVEIFDCLDNA
jgi:hypothetical protein